MTLRFGTDGVRGVANAELTPELALALGRAAARVLGGDHVVIGRDTRISGPLLEAALAAGFAAEGVDVDRLGVVPTPGVAFLSQAEGVVGAMISASHNPYADNGIKLFAPGGVKLADDVEEGVEAELEAVVATTPIGPAGEGVGQVSDRHRAVEGYIDHLVAALDGRRLDGLRVVLDCANGAAIEVAPAAFERLGADVVVVNDHPDGCNINDRCGATHPETLRLAVVDTGADAGLAFDGDADRLIAVDAMGAVVDGDHVIAICARDRRDRGRLHDDTVVVTVMTNLGFHLAMADEGITVVTTPVGDRYVLGAMEDGGWSLGGEQSGHVIFRDLATTGDGVLTGLVLLDVVARRQVPLADLAATAMTRLPQVLVNVRVKGPGADAADRIAAEVAAAEAQLGSTGRVLVRASGTEPVVRVMVEAATHDEAETVAARLAKALHPSI
ncbi:MAG TPA: phosphoglucosamine mutase [Acidimicrobiales bacterium]|nr:phosphoglucosamine mutase [Acidimicrobiales bacterium]